MPCGSRSMTSTLEPCMARLAARLTAVVVLPTPPFWFATVMIRQALGRGQDWPPDRAATAARAARAMGVSGRRRRRAGVAICVLPLAGIGGGRAGVRGPGRSRPREPPDLRGPAQRPRRPRAGAPAPRAARLCGRRARRPAQARRRPPSSCSSQPPLPAVPRRPSAERPALRPAVTALPGRRPAGPRPPWRRARPVPRGPVVNRPRSAGRPYRSQPARLLRPAHPAEQGRAPASVPPPPRLP